MIHSLSILHGTTFYAAGTAFARPFSAIPSMDVEGEDPRFSDPLLETAFGPPALPSILRLWASAKPRSVHRESGDTTTYAPTDFMIQTGLMPSVLHCELDALAVATWLLRQGGHDAPKILELRSNRRPLIHEQSIWLEEGVNCYEYGIHYVAVSDGRVYDLQSVLAPGLDIDDYLQRSFPGANLQRVLHWPNDLRNLLRLSRDFMVFRIRGYRDLPELTLDPLEKRPPIRKLSDILREAREKRARNQPDKRV